MSVGDHYDCSVKKCCCGPVSRMSSTVSAASSVGLGAVAVVRAGNT